MGKKALKGEKAQARQKIERSVCPKTPNTGKITPMGKASRRKKVTPSANRPAYRAPIPFVDRPYEGLSVEKELVAMREIIPAATLSARTNEKYGNEEVLLTTLLPEGYPAMVRKDGLILVGLQTRSNSGDLSHDAGAAVIAALQFKEDGGDGVVDIDVREPAPRLQDVLDLDSFGSMELHNSFAFWFDPAEELDAQTTRALEQTSEEIIPTEAVPGVEDMFWAKMNSNFVRYITDVEEHKLFTALARLHAAGQANLGEGTRFVGAFRAAGIAIPVFELSDGQGAAEVAEAAAALVKKLEEALTNEEPLTADERRARQGLVSRQVTIR